MKMRQVGRAFRPDARTVSRQKGRPTFSRGFMGSPRIAPNGTPRDVGPDGGRGVRGCNRLWLSPKSPNTPHIPLSNRMPPFFENGNASRLREKRRSGLIRSRLADTTCETDDRDPEVKSAQESGRDRKNR
jgi:hypothetical protein